LVKIRNDHLKNLDRFSIKMKKIKSILKNIFYNIFITYYVYKNLIIDKNSYLILTGWYESLKRGYPCNIDGAELP